MQRITRPILQLCFFFGLAICLIAPPARTHKQEAHVAGLNGGDGERIGGMGIDDGEEIGGTDIIGVMSDVESFTVNGQIIEIDERTTVTINGKPGSQNDLRRGQMVLVEANGPAASLKADHISIRYEVVGPITRVAPDTEELFVLDTRVTLASDTRKLAPLSVGDWTAVGGLRISNGEVLGTRIERREVGKAIQVYGRYSLNPDDRVESVRVGKMSADGLPLENSLVGRDVLLLAQLENGRLIAPKVTPQGGASVGDQLENFSIAAYVDQQNGQALLFGLPLIGLDGEYDVENDEQERESRLLVIDGRLAAAAGTIEVQNVHRLANPFEKASRGKDEGESEIEE